MPFEVTVESNLDALGRELAREVANELRFAVKAAAEEGARFSRQSHPYQDHTYHLTDTTNGRLLTFDARSATAVIEWPMPYASYVDKGTSRARAYPFVDETAAYAQHVLEYGVETYLERALAKLERA